MIAILAEDTSDADTLAIIVKRHFNNESLTITRKGYDGAGGLCRKGARDINAWKKRGYTRFLICHDADSQDPEPARAKVFEKVVRPANASAASCVVIPVEEIEAWIIADETAIQQIISSFRLGAHSNPESINNPKEWLIRRSKASNGKPLYSPKTFNAAVAKYLRLEVVRRKCPSFRLFLKCLDDRGH